MDEIPCAGCGRIIVLERAHVMNADGTMTCTLDNKEVTTNE